MRCTDPAATGDEPRNPHRPEPACSAQPAWSARPGRRDEPPIVGAAWAPRHGRRRGPFRRVPLPPGRYRRARPATAATCFADVPPHRWRYKSLPTRPRSAAHAGHRLHGLTDRNAATEVTAAHSRAIASLPILQRFLAAPWRTTGGSWCCARRHHELLPVRDGPAFGIGRENLTTTTFPACVPRTSRPFARAPISGGPTVLHRVSEIPPASNQLAA